MLVVNRSRICATSNFPVYEVLYSFRSRDHNSGYERCTEVLFAPLLNDIENQKYPEVVENPLLRSTANCIMPTSGTFSHSGSHMP